ncbi:alpha-amylase family glycosyl hydrolase [Mucilaginibacter paludis]|uniref:Alpha amylase catalytic region n=1 Tax=Mucilaginibacter paludis DSM 18603 TaxID=714943 RepID=H1YB96_9SPHI|nr:alpha-amylase family glycosyl hydrolase [Mucilaginibacter paludis]EHQ30622.1 alpha amylase catalytic region [Mucilaginibacter paludis DSM 18603]
MRKIYLILVAVAIMANMACSKKSDLTDSATNPVTTITNGKDLPTGAVDGVTYINSGTSVIFNLYAPGKKTVSVIGEFNNWQPSAMNQTTDGTRWWIQVDNLDASKEYAYQYLVDGTLKVADPYCEKILDPANDQYITADVYPNLKAYPSGQTGIVSVLQANPTPYTWKNTSFTRPDKKNLVIYELHVRDFIAAHNYKTLKDTLNYLSNLGVNAVELMPINEFEGNDSWGYNPSFYFAPDKYYGTRNDLKAFIDECHSRGIAVIMDMVLNHSFGQSPMVQLYFDQAAQKPLASSPWFNVDPTHPYNVGYQFNHESAATKYFAKNVMQFWMKNYKIDGYRFDLAKGFTQKNSGTADANVAAWTAYDASRVAIWKDYNSFIKSVDNNNFYVILENFATDQEEKEEADNGMMQWNNLNYSFNEGTMGWVPTSDLTRMFFNSHTFTQPDNIVTYMESHDEERLMFKNETYGNTGGANGYNVRDLATGLKRQELAAAFMLTAPGPKMMWEFGERGYDISIDNGGRLGDKPAHWEYMSDPLRKKLYNAYARLIKMKIKNPVFSTSNVQYVATGFVRSTTLQATGVNVELVGNFDVNPQTSAVTFPAAGVYYDYMTGTAVNIPTVTYTLTLAPGEYHIYSSVALN